MEKRSLSELISLLNSAGEFGASSTPSRVFKGMRMAGRLASEVLDLLTPLIVPGVTTRVTSLTVSGKQGLAAEQRVTGPFERQLGWQMFYLESQLTETVGEKLLLPLTLHVTEA